MKISLHFLHLSVQNDSQDLRDAIYPTLWGYVCKSM